MLYYVTLENKQIACLTVGELPIVTSDTVREITEAEALALKRDGLQAYLFDTALQLKPLVALTLDKPQIVSGGIDTANLTITAPGVTSLDIYFNGTPQTQPLTNGSATVPIASTAKQTINITADPLLYRFNAVTLEVV